MKLNLLLGVSVLIAGCSSTPGTPVANERVVPTDDPNIELVLGEYYEEGPETGFGGNTRNRTFSIAVRDVASGETTMWVPEQAGSEIGVFYSSAAKYLVFFWEEGDHGGEERWEVVHADGTREEIAGESPSTVCPSQEQFKQMLLWEGPTDDGYPMVAFVRTCLDLLPDGQESERVTIDIHGGPRLAALGRSLIPDLSGSNSEGVHIEEVLWTDDGQLVVSWNQGRDADGNLGTKQLVIATVTNAPPDQELDSDRLEDESVAITAPPDQERDAERFCELNFEIQRLDLFGLDGERAREALAEARVISDELVAAAPLEIRAAIEGTMPYNQALFDLIEAADFDIDAIDFSALAPLETAELDSDFAAAEAWFNANCR